MGSQCIWSLSHSLIFDHKHEVLLFFAYSGFTPLRNQDILSSMKTLPGVLSSVNAPSKGSAGKASLGAKKASNLAFQIQ